MHGAVVSTGSRPSSLRPGPSASGKAPSLGFGSAQFPTFQLLRRVQEPLSFLWPHQQGEGWSCLWRGSPGSPPGASFLEEEIIEDNRDPHPPSLKLRKESLDPGVAGPPSAPAAEGTAILTPTLHGAR